jgi:hypothetical protein
MTAIEILTAIGGTKSLATLDGFARTVWQRWGAKEVTDEQAQALAEAIEARKREVEDSVRSVIFCTPTWTKHERWSDYAASSMMFKGRKSSPDMAAWVQR